ncbi:MAG TPA: 30S ribosomal protein S2 [Candidatus Azoamicus sp. OHIO2]
MKEISVTDLFKAKIHFGHLKRFVSPNMFQYIHKTNNNMSILNLDLTLIGLKNALNFIENIIINNGNILFVGTKRQASNLIKIYAEKINMPYVNFRWLGGSLTNYNTIKNSISKLIQLEDNFKKNKNEYLTKKETLKATKQLAKLKLNLQGIKNMTILPSALFIIDINYETIAVLEAKKLNIPIIGIVDSNSNPENIDYVIPGNDDSTDSIKFYLNLISNHIIKIKEKQKLN